LCKHCVISSAETTGPAEGRAADPEEENEERTKREKRPEAPILLVMYLYNDDSDGESSASAFSGGHSDEESEWEEI